MYVTSVGVGGIMATNGEVGDGLCVQWNEIFVTLGNQTIHSLSLSLSLSQASSPTSLSPLNQA